jgi:prepilin-type N-terminal cleavage/methylation domain-containing protein
MKRLSNKGFSMIELLVVLLIIGILAAIAAPFFLQNADKTRASEAVAGAGSIRSAERNYYVQNGNSWFAVPAGTGSTYFGTTNVGQSAILGVQMANPKYFSSGAYTVIPGAVFDGSTGLTAQQYVIQVNGASSVGLSASTDGAANPTEGHVAQTEVEMDNSGQTIWSSDGGATWSKY